LKFNRLVEKLSPVTKKSNMIHKHAALLMSGGKIYNFGYNHDRMTSRKKIIMSYHAETHAINQYLTVNNCSSMKNYLNDSPRYQSVKNQYPKGN